MERSKSFSVSQSIIVSDNKTQLHHTRTYTGSTIGSLESWLLLRSLKTLHLRIPRQSETATALAQWLQTISKTSKDQVFDGVPGGVLTNVWHSSLQEPNARGFHPKNQMTGGFNATFSLEVR
jgi:cystathionine beta-lyase/cystathionine gamma-synthase